MEFKNPKVDEQANYSAEHPLKGFFQLTFAVVIIVASALIILHFFASYLVRYIPFNFEQDLVSGIEQLQLEESARQAYLQNLADKVSSQMDLPEGMTITVHYVDDDLVNAFATVGGHVFFYRGLVDKLKSEDALTMVMAHEIAHIKYRHPLSAMSKGLTLVLAGAAVSGFSGSSAGDALIGNTMNIGLLNFSRQQETQADEAALAAIKSIYGHVLGAKELFLLFSSLQNESVGGTGMEFFRSHPYSINRWNHLKLLAEQKRWPITGQLQSLDVPE